MGCCHDAFKEQMQVFMSEIYLTFSFFPYLHASVFLLLRVVATYNTVSGICPLHCIIVYYIQDNLDFGCW